MKKRNLLVCFLLSVITLGIYFVYWQCSFQGQLKEQTGKGFGAVGHFFMCLFTCGIYSIYWQYAAGKRLAEQGAEDHSILYIVLVLVGVGSAVNMFLMQNQANNLA